MPDQLEAGALWAENPACLMQTHLSEQVDEIEWVRSLFPNTRDYLDTYEQFDLLGERAIYGHLIYLESREIDQISEHGAALVHYPTSKTFIRSSFSMLRTMAAAYEIGQLRGTVLHAVQLLWLAKYIYTRLLYLRDKIDFLDIDMEADIAALNLAIAPRYDNA